MWIEKVFVILIVAAAAAWCVRFFSRTWRGKSKCGCGSSGCPAAKEAADRMLRSIETNTSGRNRIDEGDGHGREVPHATQ